MNFIYNYIKLAIIFLGLCFISIAYSISNRQINLEGVPFINNYPLPEPFGFYHVNSVVKDSSGTVYLALNDNIVCLYNNDYDILTLPGKVILLKFDNKIYVSADHFIGYLKIGSFGTPYLQPIIDDSIAELYNINGIENFTVCKKTIYFTSGNVLYRLKANKPVVVDTNKNGFNFYSDRNGFYVHPKGRELIKVCNGIIQPLNKGKHFANKTIKWLTSDADGISLMTDNNQFYYVDIDGNVVEKNNFKGLDKNISISGVSQYNDSIYIVTSPQKGIQFYTLDNRLVNTINSDNGLPENKIKQIIVDDFKNIIAVFDNYISIIRTGYPLSFFGPEKGITGRINDIIVFRGQQYIATTNGLFKFSNKQNDLVFEHLSDIGGSGLKFRLIDSAIYYISSNGIFKISNDKVDQLYKEKVISESIIEINNKTYFLLGTEDVVKVLILKNGSISKLNEFKTEEPITKIITDKKGYIWFLSGLNKISILQEDMIRKGGKLKNISILKSTVNSIVVNNNLLYFISKQDIYIFDYNNNVFIKDSIITNLEQGKTLRLYPISTNDQERQWYTYSDMTNNNYGLLILNNLPGKNRIQFINVPYKISGIAFVHKNDAWIGSYNGLLHYNMDMPIITYNKLNTRIKEVRIGNDSVVQLEQKLNIEYSLNDLRFSFATSQIENDLVQYQYRLVNYNKNWSEWTNQTVKDYTNLSPGKYKYQLRSRNLNGLISPVVEYRFQVKRPFYLSIPFYTLYVIVGLIILFVFFRWRTWVYLKENEKLESLIHERTDELMREKEKTEQLLANVLPKGTADELKSTGKATSQKFSMATVLFSDIQGFTKIAEYLNPDTLIDQLDSFFFQFDSVVERYNIEKIKTIGDAYMCAGGIPNKNITNPVEVVLAALEMQDYMHDLKSRNSDIWDLRIGIHTGSVIAGVVGQKKLSYDIWGDTVNVASRMESSGEAGKVNVSGQTYEHIKEFYVCEYRGKMPVKYKGEIDMYFVKGIRPELSQNMKNIPNKKFLIKLQMLRLRDLEDFVFEKYENELPKNLHFHNIAHVKENYNYCELLSKANDLSEEERLLLNTASLIHDIGYIGSYENHEVYSIEYSQKVLAQFRYTPDQIDRVCELINVTQRGQKAQNILEEILLDSIMSYIGRPDFIELSEALYNELSEYKLIQSKEEWVKMQITLLSNHKFNTKAANLLREIPAEQQIELLIQSFEKKSL